MLLYLTIHQTRHSTALIRKSHFLFHISNELFSFYPFWGIPRTPNLNNIQINFSTSSKEEEEGEFLKDLQIKLFLRDEIEASGNWTNKQPFRGMKKLMCEMSAVAEVRVMNIHACICNILGKWLFHPHGRKSFAQPLRNVSPTCGNNKVHSHVRAMKTARSLHATLIDTNYGSWGGIQVAFPPRDTRMILTLLRLQQKHSRVEFPWDGMFICISVKFCNNVRAIN